MRKLISGAFTKLFYVIALMSLCGMAFAADKSIGHDATTDVAVTNHTDLSLNYLGQVFGSVGTALQGSSGQMLGKLFLKLNEGIIVVAGLWLVYTLLTIVLRAAQEGSFMGHNKNVALTFLKIAVGFSLLIPNPSTGYSLIQDIVMRVVVEGVGLADSTWRYGLDYIKQGGTVWHRPEQSGNGDLVISADTAKSLLTTNTSNHAPAQQIFASAVCMYASNDYQSNNQSKSLAAPRMHYSVYTDDSGQKFNFPGVGDNLPFGPNSNKCGSISWQFQSCNSSNKDGAQCQYSKEAVSQLITSLLPAAKRYYCSQHSAAASCIGVNTDDTAATNEQYVFSGLINYFNLVLPMEQMMVGGADQAKSFIPAAENEGWMTAGRYYWDLAQVQMHYNNISSLDNYVPTGLTQVTAPGEPGTAAKNASGEFNTYIDPVLGMLTNYHKAQHAGDTGNNYPEWNAHSGDAGSSITQLILDRTTGGIVGLIRMFGAQSQGGTMGYDPILFLHKVGMYCIKIAGNIWVGWLGLMASILFPAGTCNAMYDSTPAFRALLSWIQPLVMAIAAGLWVSGFALGFYVPMYPYIIFTFGVIGWIVTVIEAMVAAPLVCFGLTHPEGHDFLGQAQQALMLLLGVFLRPVLMIIGLIAAMILSYVSLRIVVHTFTGFATDLFYIVAPHSGGSDDVLAAAGTLMGQSLLDTPASNTTGFVISLLVFPLVLIIFTLLVYTVVLHCFSLVYRLPDYILLWIGGPAQQSQIPQMMQQVQGVLGRAGQSSAQAMGSSASGAGQEVSQVSRERRNENRDRDIVA